MAERAPGQGARAVTGTTGNTKSAGHYCVLAGRWCALYLGGRVSVSPQATRRLGPLRTRRRSEWQSIFVIGQLRSD